MFKKKKQTKGDFQGEKHPFTSLKLRLSSMTVQGLWVSMLFGFVVVLLLGTIVALLLFLRVSGEVVYIGSGSQLSAPDEVSKEELQKVLERIELEIDRHESLKKSFTNPARNPIQYQSVIAGE